MTARPLLRWKPTLVTLALVLLMGVPSAGGLAALHQASTTGPVQVTQEIYGPGLTTASPIKHVIVIIQENHGTDNYFSQFPGAFGMPPGGVPQPGTHGNVGWYANQYTLGWNYAANQSSSVPAHGQDQIWGNMDNTSMDGFTYTDSNVSNGYYPSYIVANELGLAQEYGFADNYFQAFAGPTLPNRFYYYGITSGPITGDAGPANGSNMVYFPSLPQELEQYGVSWNDYDGNYNTGNGSSCLLSLFPNCPSWYFTTTLSQLQPMLYFNWIQQYAGQLGHEQPWSQLYTDLYTNNLPAVSWYTQDWLNGTEHPGTIAGFGGNVTQGQQGIVGVIRAVENSPYWNSTAIFLSYDEGGGFFDHVPAPDITGLGDGIRIPLVVISPYAKEGYISHAYYSPTSILRFIEWNWNLPALGTLDGLANNPLDFFNFNAAPRLPLPQSVWGGSSELTSFPWPYVQPAPGLYGNYTPYLVTNHSVSWAYQTDNSLLSSPVVTADGSILYLAGSDGILRAFNPTSGAELWARSLGLSSRSAPALLPSDGVIASTLHGTLTAYTSGGSLLWNTSVGAPIYGGLTLVQGKYYGALTNGSLFGVDANGTTLWVRNVSPYGIYNPPTYDPSTGFLVASASLGGVVATNLQGVVQWTASIPGGVYGAPAVSAGTAYVTTTAGGIYPIATSGGIVGTPATFPASITSPYISGSTLYAGNETGVLQAFTIPGLTAGWTTSLYGDVAGTPVVSGSDLWVASGGGYLYEFPAAGGAPLQVLHSETSFYAGPTVTSSGTYFAAEDGNLYALVQGALPRPGWVAGTVTNQSNGSPVAGASVLFTSPGGSVTATAGPSGTFNQSFLPGSYAWFVNASGYLPQSGTLTITASKTTPLAIALVPWTGVHPGFLDVRLAPTQATLSVNGTAEPVQSSGIYSLALPPYPYRLQASASGYTTQTTSVTLHSYLTTFWNATLLPTGGATSGWAAGTVTNGTGGLPLSGVLVDFRSKSGGGTFPATSATGGTYNVSLTAGSYAVFANATGYYEFFGNVTVPTSHTVSLDVPLRWVVPSAPPQSGTIAGGVYQTSVSSQNALSGVQLLFMPGAVSVTSGSSGAYSVSLGPGTYSVFVNRSGYQAYSTTGLVVTAGATTTQNIVLSSTACTSSCPSPNQNHNSTGGINWLLWGLILAAVAAAFVILAVVVLKGKKEKTSSAPPPAAEETVAPNAYEPTPMADGSGGGMAAGPDPSAMEPPADTPPTDSA